MIYFFLVLLIIAWYALGRKNVLMKGLYGIYIIAAIASILYIFIDPDCQFFYKTKYEPLLYLLIVLVIVFDGFSGFTFNFEYLSLRKERILKFANIISWLFIPVVLLLVYNSVRVLMNVDLTSYRQEGNFYETGLFQGGIFLSLCVYISELSFIPHFLFFYLLTFNGVKKSMMIRLFLASFSFAFMTLMFAGRDGIVFWLMNSVIYYSIFKDLFTVSTKKTVKRAGIIVLVLAMIPFLAISAARFMITGSGSFSETIEPFVSYIGQGPHVFCQSFYVNQADIEEIQRETVSAAMVESLQLYLGWTFGTFVKTLVWSFGKLGALLVAIVLNIISRKVINMYKKKYDIWSFFLIIMLYQIPYWGVFYYRYSINNMEIVYGLFAIICLLMYARGRIVTKMSFDIKERA